MAVYVDTMEASFGRMIMCHCWADSRDELFAMMVRIGVNVKWFQQPPKASWEHFDISKSKRALAVKHGAIETDIYGPLVHTTLLDLAICRDVPTMVRLVNKLERIHRMRIKPDG